jgi:hypothetical protein
MLTFPVEIENRVSVGRNGTKIAGVQTKDIKFSISRFYAPQAMSSL